MNELEPCHCGYHEHIPDDYKPFKRGALVQYKKEWVYKRKKFGVMKVVAHPVFCTGWQVPTDHKSGMMFFCGDLELVEEKDND